MARVSVLFALALGSVLAVPASAKQIIANNDGDAGCNFLISSSKSSAGVVALNFGRPTGSGVPLLTRRRCAGSALFAPDASGVPTGFVQRLDRWVLLTLGVFTAAVALLLLLVNQQESGARRRRPGDSGFN